MADMRGEKKRNFSRNKRRNQKARIITQKKKKWEEIDEEVLSLTQRYNEVNSKDLKQFSDFPVCTKTKKGLGIGKYVSPTEIQRESILLALQGHDILGAAKTGSGKTLAFLIPVLECLFRQKWTQLDGLGALIISPTRELAYQIFEVLRTVGKFHDFSAGLVIGGKFLKEEAERISKTNIVICTPGRLLQHMDQTVNFNADNLQVLVLDEADRILDLGFQECMNGIIQNLPTKRQTLLFSATQTKSVKDLARLSLKEPMYVSVHEHSKHSTPTQLQQSYIVCELHEKLDVLWSFVKNHLKKKVLVFLSSCKQVRYVYEVFRRLRPGTTVLALHGAMQQMKRVATYEAFCRKQNAVLFATDVAARGLDFPAVHWVIQMDCPEDAHTYIHRAGRTARYEKDGEVLLILLPNEEEAMVKQLNDKKIPINKIRVNAKKIGSVQPKLESICASEVQMKEFAQRAFMSYLKSVFFMSNKAVFDVTKLDTDSYARSLGLAIPPRIRFLQKERQRQEVLRQKQMQSESVQNKVTGKKSSTIKLDSNNVLKSKTQARKKDEDSERSESDVQNESNSEFNSDKSDTESEFDSSENELSENESDSQSDDSDQVSIHKKLANKYDKNKQNNPLSEMKREAQLSSVKDKLRIEENESDSAESGSSDSESESQNESEGSESDDSDVSDTDDSIRAPVTKSNKDTPVKGNIKKLKTEKVLMKGMDTTISSAETAQSGARKKSSKTKCAGNLIKKSEAFSFNTGENDGDDLLKIKKKDQSENEEDDTSDIELACQKKKKEKVLTKAALAKKILKKNLKVNSKVVFDDEGQAVVNVLKKSQVSLDDEDDEANEGGISIEEARRRMKQEDKLDKEIFKQKIKAKHKEEKRKEKERRRAEYERRKAKYEKEEQEVILGPAEGDNEDEGFNSEDEDIFADNISEGSSEMMANSESEDGSEGETESTEGNDFDSETDELNEKRSHTTKRKGQTDILQGDKKKRKKDSTDFDTGLSLMDDEDLALKLLHS